MRAALLSVLAAIISFVQAVPNPKVSTVVNVRSQVFPETCGNGNVTDLVALYETYAVVNTVHFYTIIDKNVTVALQEGQFAFNGVIGLIFPTLQPSTLPFLCLTNARTTSFFYTTSETERANALATGYTDYTTMGYIYTSQVCGSVPLYRVHFIGANADYIYTTSIVERDNAIVQGFVDEGIAGYVMEPPSGMIIN
ncbi:hypothetical protein MVEN_01315900 [Mycena venus]|uniref:DUF5648 domain-containing protein n=1 Tax=Mycena venus TaxID=2733690 RepID=A0A8H6Y186_9AGAR|nr:hypothetical protein MVEN_01315900 [Mycena venus]